MGRIYLRTLADCANKGALLAVKCGACERLVYTSADRLIGRTVKLSSGHRDKLTGTFNLAEVETLLICRGGQGSVGCGAKMAEIRAVWPHEIRGVPAGVPILPWIEADDRERKRMIRKARG